MAKFRMKQFASGSCYSYVLDSEGEAVIADPHISLPKEYSNYLEKHHLRLKYIIDTHTHADHFSSAAILKKEYKASILMGKEAVSEIADKRLKDGDEVAFGSSRLKIFYTPGHTDDAIGLYGEGKLFTGDVLLIGSVGRTDFQNGSPESMFDTLQKLKTFHFDIPQTIAGVDSNLLNPRNTWSNPADYDAKARELAEKFRANFKKFNVSEAILKAGPVIES